MVLAMSQWRKPLRSRPTLYPPHSPSPPIGQLYYGAPMDHAEPLGPFSSPSQLHLSLADSVRSTGRVSPFVIVLCWFVILSPYLPIPYLFGLCLFPVIWQRGLRSFHCSPIGGLCTCFVRVHSCHFLIRVCPYLLLASLGLCTTS